MERKSGGGAARKKPANRVRATKRSLEAKQFSSIPLPRTSEVTGANAHIHEVVAAPSSGAAVFDPIPNDGMFFIVANSKHWPPPPLADLGALDGNNMAGGMDLYDRRADEAHAKKAKVARIEGEVNHPRGKATKNTKVAFDD
jgi:hypothetical protein